MTRKLFNAELRYYTIIRIAKMMLAEGQITKKEFALLRKRMAEKYNPFLTNAED